MFMHGFDGYMRHAYPSDKVSFPLISAAGPPSMPSIPTSYVILSANCIRKESRDQCNCLFTLVDSLDSIAVLFTVNRQIIAGKDAFIDAVQKVTEQISFEHDLFVDVPLLTTRVLGGLLSAHILATEPQFGFSYLEYEGKLLEFAVDLADRLLEAVGNTKSDLGRAVVHLEDGFDYEEESKIADELTNTAAGALMLEFGILSRLTDDQKYEDEAKAAAFAVWDMRSEIGLLGTKINAATSEWTETTSGLDTGTVKYIGHLLKAHILFGDRILLEMFKEANTAVKQWLLDELGYVHETVDINNGNRIERVLFGEVEDAKTSNLVDVQLWAKYSAMPEAFQTINKQPNSTHYHLQADLAESLYYLYRATSDPFYLKAGERMLLDIDRRCRTKCGFAGLTSVTEDEKTNVMDSWFLSQTLKYLYLLFDKGWITTFFLQVVYVLMAAGHVLYLPETIAEDDFYEKNDLTCPLQKREFLPMEFRDDFDWVNDFVGASTSGWWEGLGTCMEPQIRLNDEYL